MKQHSGPLDYERQTLRRTIRNLLSSQPSIETLCTFIPRLTNAAANVVRAEALVTGNKANIAQEIVLNALHELEQQISEKENTNGRSNPHETHRFQNHHRS